MDTIKSPRSDVKDKIMIVSCDNSNEKINATDFIVGERKGSLIGTFTDIFPKS